VRDVARSKRWHGRSRMQKLRRESARLDADVAPLSHVCSQGVRATAAWPPGTVKSPICSRASSTLASRSVRRRVCGVRSSAVRCVQRPQPIVADSALVPACWAPVPPPPPPAPWQGRLRALVERTVPSCGLISNVLDACARSRVSGLESVTRSGKAKLLTRSRPDAQVVSCVSSVGFRRGAVVSRLLAGCSRLTRAWPPGVRKSTLRSRTHSTLATSLLAERCCATSRPASARCPVRRSVGDLRDTAVRCVQRQQLGRLESAPVPTCLVATLVPPPPAFWQEGQCTLVECTVPSCGRIVGAFDACRRVRSCRGSRLVSKTAQLKSCSVHTQMQKLCRVSVKTGCKRCGAKSRPLARWSRLERARPRDVGCHVACRGSSRSALTPHVCSRASGVVPPTLPAQRQGSLCALIGCAVQDCLSGRGCVGCVRARSVVSGLGFGTQRGKAKVFAPPQSDAEVVSCVSTLGCRRCAAKSQPLTGRLGPKRARSIGGGQLPCARLPTPSLR